MTKGPSKVLLHFLVVFFFAYIIIDIRLDK